MPSIFRIGGCFAVIFMKVSIHTASHIVTRLAVARVSRLGLGFRVRVRVSRVRVRVS